MLYYAQKLTGGTGRASETDLEATPAIFHNEDAGEPFTQGPSVATTPQIT